MVECELGCFEAAGAPEGAVDVVIRPEDVELRLPASANGHVEGVVLDHRSYGHDHVTYVRLPSGRMLRSRRLGFARLDPGASVEVHVDARVTVLPVDQPGGTAR
jgi:hypothetical protein